MFWEVALQPSKHDLHGFLVKDPVSGTLQDHRMKRLTFGVTSSPFLASRVLQKVAIDYSDPYLRASIVIKQDFYLDDCVSGADSLDEAVSLRIELNALLAEMKMTLRKW